MTSLIPFIPLFASTAILLMGNGLQGTLLPVRATLESFGSLDVGILGSAYFVGFLSGCLLGPYIVRAVGHIRTFTAMVALASSVVLVHSLFLEPVVWWILRAGTGFCFAILYMVVESWLNEKATNENRGMVFSAYTVLNLTVITAGQILLMVDDPKAFPLFALASILVSIAAVPVALSPVDQPAPLGRIELRMTRLFRVSPVGVMGCFAVGLANGAFWSIGPIYAIAASPTGGSGAVALFMSGVVIAGALGQWPLGVLSDRIDRRLVIIAACLGAAVAGLCMAFVAPGMANGALIFGFAFGVFAFPIYALSVAHLNDFISDPAGYVEAASALLLVFAAGAIVGPVLASALIEMVGITYLFAYTAAVHLAMALFAAYRMRIRAPAPSADHIEFGDAIRLAQTISTVDPRAGSASDADNDADKA